MGAIKKVLIEDGMKVWKLPGPVGVRAMGTVETGVVGIVGGPTIALDSLGMFVTAWQERYAE